MKRMKLLFTLALPILLAQDVLAQSSRLIAQANWYNNGTVFVRRDTTSYSYTNPRGGDLNHQLKFDNSYMWTVAGDTSLINNQWTTQEFYSDNSVKSTTVQTWDAFSGSWRNSTRVNYWYNSDGTVDYSIYQTWGGSSWTNISKNDYTYGSGHLIRDEYQMWNGVTFVATSAKVYSYDASNNVTQVLSQSYESGIWVYTNLYEYTYTSMNWLSSTVYSVWNGSSFQNRTQYANTYDTAGNMLTQVYQTYNTTGGTWNNNTLSTFSNFTAARMAQTRIDETWDSASASYSYAKQYTYTYNSNNQLTSSTAISWNRAGFWQYVLGDARSNYYYGSYTAGVKNVTANDGTITVFPVPAANSVNIKLNWENVQPFQVAIYSVTGVMVNSWSVEPTAQYNVAVPVNHLPAGNYVVRVTGKNGQLAQQFTVAH